ncbi:MAG: hypothetical protein JWM57_3990 [Phycisphaerales bacterium]|nr:hypothetical protein [Phycisphaerales bacterium]
MHHPAPAARPLRSLSVIESLETRQHLSTVTISTARAQTIDGFGTSLGGVTSVSLVKTPQFQKAYYRDLGASMFRVVLNPWILAGTTANGGKSIGAPVVMGPHIEANAAMFDFNNFNIKKYGQMARAALKYGSEVSLIGSFWSPPYWMKGEEVSAFNGKPTGVMPTFDDKTGNTAGGSLIDTDANLTQFARYISAYVYGFEKAYGVHLSAISIQNELAFHEYYSSAVYSPELYVKAVKAVDHWFKIYGITTKIIGPEDVGVGATDNTGILNRQMAYIKALRQDPAALAAVDTYAIHGYANDGVTSMRSPEMWSRYWNGYTGGGDYGTFAGIKSDHKESYMTESSGYSNTWNGTMRFAGAVQDALVYGNISAYVYWGITNSSDSGEALMTGADYTSNKYEAFKHFSKYIRPGAVRLQTTGNDPTAVEVSAFVDDKAKTLTSVLVNSSDQAQDVTLKLDGITLSAFKTAYASTESFTWKALKAYRISHGQVIVNMPAKSIFTLVGTTGNVASSVAAGSIVGVYFNDKNKNGKQDKGEAGLGGDKVFLDMDADGVRDRREPTAITDANGRYKFSGLASGIYRVRREVVNGYAITTPPSVTRLKRGAMSVTGAYLGSVKMTVTPPAVTGASISGHSFGDTNGNGKQDSGESNAVSKVIYLDANNNGSLDAGEKQTKTDSAGNFSFAGLAAGTYRVRRVFPQGFKATTPAITFTLTSNDKRTGLMIGGRAI